MNDYRIYLIVGIVLGGLIVPTYFLIRAVLAWASWEVIRIANPNCLDYTKGRFRIVINNNKGEVRKKDFDTIKGAIQRIYCISKHEAQLTCIAAEVVAKKEYEVSNSDN